MPSESSSPVSRRKLGLFGLIVGVAAVLIVVTGIRAREDSSAKLREWTDTQAVPTVAVTLPDARVLVATLDLPGRLEAYQRAPISRPRKPTCNSPRSPPSATRTC